MVDSAIFKWPSGITNRLDSLVVNQLYNVVEDTLSILLAKEAAFPGTPAFNLDIFPNPASHEASVWVIFPHTAALSPEQLNNKS